MTKDQLTILLNKYISEELTQSEFQTLWATLQNTDYTNDWEKMADEVFNTPAYAMIEDTAKQRLILTKILQGTTASELENNPTTIPTTVHRVHFLKTAWFRYAALLIIAAGAAIWLWTRPADISSKPVAHIATPADIEPPGNMAMLTLADGSTILLDSAINGNLANEGGTRIAKSGNGLVEYTAPHLASAENAGPVYNTISTPRGGRYQITLADGTKVWLNAASSIRFPTQFANERSVTVTGEVYFEVAQDVSKPFSVQTDNGTKVQVLGTSFNIMAYKDEKDTRTSLVEGSVKMVNGTQSVLLKPSEQGVLTTAGRLSVNSDANFEETIAWKNGMFIFDNTDLDIIMRRISRWYDVDIVYDGSASGKHYTGSVRSKPKVSDVLRKLELAGGVSFVIDGKNIKVKLN